MATAAFLDLKKYKILLANGVRRSEMLHCAKYSQNGSVYYRHTVIFHFSKMAAAAILDMQNSQISLAVRVQGKMRNFIKICHSVAGIS